MNLLAFALLAVTETAALAEATHVGRTDSVESSGAMPNVVAITYKLSGNRTVLPSSIYDDGARTYIQWAPSQSIPAVFGLDERGREELVNGYMRDGLFTIDRVYSRLVFRVDDDNASANRKLARKK